MKKRDILCEIGCEGATTHDGRVVYSFDRMVECLMHDDGMTYEDAVGFIEYNTIRALPYFPNAPVVLQNECFFEDDGED